MKRSRHEAIAASTQQSPRLVIVDPSTAPTGALRAAANIARAADGRVETVLVVSARADIPEAELRDFDRVVRIPMRQIRRSWRDLLLYAPTLIAGSGAIARLLTPGSVLVLNDFYLMQGLLVGRLRRKIRIITWVRTDPLAFPAPLRRLWLRAARSTADAVVAVSDFIVGRLADQGIASTRLYDPVSAIDALPDDRTTERRDLVQIANYTGGKGQNDAIAAFARIADRHPDTRLAFHGGSLNLDRNRRYRAALETQAAATGLGDRIIFRGFTADVASALASATAALVLSQRESFSLACLEAAQCAVPVIATRCGGPEEIVADGVTGVLCDVGDIDAIAEAMDRLLGLSAEASARMGEAGARLVRQRFSPEAFARGVHALLGLDDTIS